jgi:hypothetical protein
MKTNELRIGNWVSFEDHLIKQQRIVFLSEKADLSMVEPIPLTEDWLLRFGFDSLGKFGFGIGKFHIENTNNLRGKFKHAWHYRVISRKIIAIYYVHQLQNLYFALRGEELELKE